MDDGFIDFCSTYEGYAVLKAHVDKLWDAVKDPDAGIRERRRYALQVAATAVKFVKDVCSED